MRYPRLKHAVEAQLFNLAKERWGDVPISVKSMTWEDGSYQLTAFHTIERVRDGEPLRVDLIYDSETGVTIERVVHLRVQQRRETLYEEEVDL